MTTTSVDHHQLACDAMQRNAPLLVEAIRNAPGDVAPKGMRWTCAEIAAHVYGSLVEAEKAVRGEPSVLDGMEISAELDELVLAQVPERDIIKLAELTEDQIAAFLLAARAQPADRATALPRVSVHTAVGVLVLDHHLHGGQFAESAGTSWNGRPADLHSPLRAVLPYVFDPAAAKDFRGSFALRLKGAEAVRYAIEAGQLELDPEGRIDCRITADAQTFLRLGLGIVSQLRASLTGKLIASGRKPWLALAVTRLFPTVPHGGLAR